MAKANTFQFRIRHLLVLLVTVASVSAWMRWAVYGGVDVGVMANGLERVEEMNASYRSNIGTVWLREQDRKRVTPDVDAYDDDYVISRLDKISGFENLSEVKLCGSPITTRTVYELCKLGNVRTIDIRNTPLDDSVLPILQEAKHLRCVLLHGTSVSEDGRERLREALPSCRIP